MANVKIVRTDFGLDLRGYARTEVDQHLAEVAEYDAHREALVDSLTRELENCSNVVEELNAQVQQFAYDRAYLEERLEALEHERQQLTAERDQAMQQAASAGVDTDHVATDPQILELKKLLAESDAALTQARARVSSLEEQDGDLAATSVIDTDWVEAQARMKELEDKTVELSETEAALQRAHDRIAELEALHSSDALAAALERAKRAEEEAEEAEETSRLLKRTLITAQRTADELIEETRFQAATVRHEADEYAKKVRGEADSYAEETRSTVDAYDHEVRTKVEADTTSQITQANQQAETIEREAKATADKLIDEARDNAASRVERASNEAQEMRESAQKILHESLHQAKRLADLRRTYASRARAAIEDQVEEFINVAKLPDFPDELQTYIDLHS